MKILLYHQHLSKSANLIEGRLLLLDSESPSIANTYIATSGLPNNQRFDCLSSPGKGSIPANNVIGNDCYLVATTPIYMPSVKGVEGNFYKINPHMVTVNGVQRGDFGIHFDANVPGSSGCVVLRTDIGWQAFEKDMKNLLTSGVKEIPLLVSYSR
ncbi:hypothetical protein NIES4075_25110 [Tolypothrix sp. NIES-4075]|uniref:hypothetical protein n=1 Tax=Tolypothrix sp. NIES-4075 TaxID=2005459 RepID=UPI000B66302D|nr:hypothetical protein [Tolypothrix sp. NIES-4075]GAX41538.1 hypothetical protein NIES4075_25110 [Tolypothrix sp. NIES-4075]